MHSKIIYSGICISLAVSCSSEKKEDKLSVELIDNVKPRNVIFILSDDHRYDFMGFMKRVPWLQTPNLDKMAANGCHIRNAFVTTSLSSPSRASILTGQFSHEHTVVDNEAPVPDNLIYFPQYLQKNGYQTGFFGKWHMGNTDDMPQPGFDRWVSFKGQGTYFQVQLNIDGERISYPDTCYVTDLLNQQVMDFISNRNPEKPFFAYLSHKAVHSEFMASKKYEGIYKDKPVPYPESIHRPEYGSNALPSVGKDGKPQKGQEWYGEGRMPDWVKQQRESWHGVEYCYHGSLTFEEEFRKYCETITSLDESIGVLMNFLEKNGLDKNTLIIYMGDNGFSWGEHGLIDKRHFYEESVRIPMLAYCPEIIPAGTVTDRMIQNIDIAPTIMEAAGMKKAPQMRGKSMLSLIQGKPVEKWRDRIFYEYYWEYDFPQTPTTFGVRTDQYKYIRYQGVWDTNEFYDLKNDPGEMNNQIVNPAYQETIRELSGELYDWLEETEGMQIPLKRTVKHRFGDHRNQQTY